MEGLGVEGRVEIGGWGVVEMVGFFGGTEEPEDYEEEEGEEEEILEQG